MKRLVSVGVLVLAVLGSLAFSARHDEDFSSQRSKKTSSAGCCVTISRDTN